MATLDIDIFVGFRAAPGNPIVDPRPIYDYLKSRGGAVQDEYIVVAGWPVQFLPPGNPLVEEALVEATKEDVEGVPVRVFSAEHLAAIALQTGRAKDKARLLQFLEADVLDMQRFKTIVSCHRLDGLWQRFEQQFLTDRP